MKQRQRLGLDASELRCSSNKNDFSHEVKEVMDGCLACKACANQCPINVDVRVLNHDSCQYIIQGTLDPGKIAVSNIEKMAPVLAKAPD